MNGRVIGVIKVPNGLRKSRNKSVWLIFNLAQKRMMAHSGFVIKMCLNTSKL